MRTETVHAGQGQVDTTDALTLATQWPTPNQISGGGGSTHAAARVPRAVPHLSLAISRPRGNPDAGPQRTHFVETHTGNARDRDRGGCQAREWRYLNPLLAELLVVRRRQSGFPRWGVQEVDFLQWGGDVVGDQYWAGQEPRIGRDPVRAPPPPSRPVHSCWTPRLHGTQGGGSGTGHTGLEYTWSATWVQDR